MGKDHALDAHDMSKALADTLRILDDRPFGLEKGERFRNISRGL